MKKSYSRRGKHIRAAVSLLDWLHEHGHNTALVEHAKNSKRFLVHCKERPRELPTSLHGYMVEYVEKHGQAARSRASSRRRREKRYVCVL